MFYFWNILSRHKAYINKKTHKHKTRTGKKVAETYLQKKNVFKSYHIMIIIIFLTFILSNLFFVRTTRIAEKERAWKRGKTQGQREKKTGKGNKKEEKKHGKRAKKTNVNKERDEEEEETETYERWDENEEPENKFEEEEDE